MTKPRNGHHSIVFEMIRILGLHAAHEITGVSESLIRKWADPDEEREISFARALALNAACVERNKGNPLLALLWEETPNGAEDDAAVDLGSATRRVTAALGELNMAIDAALCPDSPGGTQITA